MTVFINKGDAPLTPAQAINRGLALYNSEMALYQREAGMLTGSQAFATWANQWLTDNVTNTANNAWNVELASYRAAVARLARYELSKGQLEVTAQEPDPTGALDANGDPVMVTLVMQPAVDPLPATVDSVDDQGNPVTVPNPAIVQDEAERAAAQAVVTATPADVVAWE